MAGFETFPATFSSSNTTEIVTTTSLSSIVETTSKGLQTVSTSHAAAGMDPLNVFRIFVCAIGSLANLTVIIAIIILQEYRKGITSWYILQLAIADLVFLLTIPFQVIEDQNNAWIYNEGMCKAKQAILFINYYASITFLTVMAVDRYIAICHGFSAKWQNFRSHRKAYITTLFVWIVCICMTVPVMMYSSVQGINPTCKCRLKFPTQPETAKQKCEKEGFHTEAKMSFCFQFFKYKDSKLCDDPAPKSAFQMPIIPQVKATTPSIESHHVIQQNCQYVSAAPGFRTFLYFNFFVMFLVPFIIICVCYTLIVVYVKRTTFRGDAQTQRSDRSRSRNRVVVMCAALVVMFTICWLPYHVQHLAKMSGIPGKSSQFCLGLSQATSVLIYLNSAINPFLYSLITKFRSQMAKVKETRAGTALASLFTRPTSSGHNSNKSKRADTSDTPTSKRFTSNPDNSSSGI